MGKVIRRWAELDWSTTGVIRAQDIPYDEFNSIHDELTGRPLSPASTYDNEIALFTWSGAESDPTIKQLKSSNTYLNNNTAMGNASNTIPSEFVVRSLVEGASGYVPLAGTSNIYGSLIPSDDDAYQLGDATSRWSQIYADEIHAITAFYTQMEYNTLSSMFLVLNTPPFSGSPFADGGIIINRGASPSAALVWDESALRWTAGLASGRENILLSGDDLGVVWERTGTTVAPINAGDEVHVASAKIDSTTGTANSIVISTSAGVVGTVGATVRDLSGASILNLNEFSVDPTSAELNDYDMWVVDCPSTSAKMVRYYLGGQYYTMSTSSSGACPEPASTSGAVWGSISGSITDQIDLTNATYNLETGWIPFTTSFAYSLPTQVIVDNTAVNAEKFKVGRPLRYSTDGINWDYGIVTAYSSGSITVAGAEFSSLNLYLQTGDMAKATQVDFKVAGAYADSTDTTLLYNDMNAFFRWKLGTAYCVNVAATHKIQDTSSPQPTIGFTIGGNVVTNLTLSNAGTWVESTTIDTANYQVNRNDDGEIACTTIGTNLDSEDLTVSCTFIIV